ncbi:acyl carrier protein [Spirillospora sp. CA-255316]
MSIPIDGAIRPAHTEYHEVRDVPALRSDLLDCIQANLALLADLRHGPGSHLRLGAGLRFSPRPGRAGLPTVEPQIPDHLEDADRLLGLATTAYRRAARILEDAAGSGPALVIGDAFHLPWVPYHGRHHVEHSFAVVATGSGHLVYDAYHNDTEWGPARPTRLSFSAKQMAEILAGPPDGADVITFAGTHLGPPPEPFTELDDDRVDHYLRAYSEHADRVEALGQFTLETWLLARSRGLHAAYLADRAGGLPDDVQAHLDRWARLTEHAYLTYRRVERGRAEPPDLLARAAEVLHADVEIFQGRDAAGPADDGVHAVVCAVLGVDQVPHDADLTEYPQFNSLRMLEIVDRLETTFQVQFDPLHLVPEKLRRVDSLRELLRLARTASHSSEKD